MKLLIPQLRGKGYSVNLKRARFILWMKQTSPKLSNQITEQIHNITTSPRGIWVFSTQNCFNILSKLSSLTMKLVDVKGNRQTRPIQRGKSIRKKQPVRGLRYHLPKAILKRGIINIFEESKDLMLKEVNEGVITINY